jgi:hypothetical protein
MTAHRSSSKNKGKMNLVPVLNKTSPRAHMELEVDMFGDPGKLVKYVVHPKEKIEKNLFFFTQAAQIAIDQFLVSKNCRS